MSFRGGWGGQRQGFSTKIHEELNDIKAVASPLFPDAKGSLPPKVPISEHERKLIDTSKNLTKYFADSPFHLNNKIPPPDIKRWVDRFKKVNKEKKLSTIYTDLTFLPDELHSCHTKTSGAKRRRQTAHSSADNLLNKLNFDENEENASSSDDDDDAPGSKKKRGGDDDEDDEGLDDAAEDDDDADDDNDYLVNHFSDGDEYAGGDGDDGGAEEDTY